MSNQIADIYTNLLDSFWKPYYTELGFQIKQYVASICYMACATNDGIIKLTEIEEPNTVAAMSLLRSLLDLCIEVKRAGIVKDKAKYFDYFLQDKDTSQYKEGKIQYSSRVVRKYITVPFFEEGWNITNKFTHPFLSHSDNSTRFGFDSTYDDTNIVIYDLENFTVISNEDLIENAVAVNQLLISYLEELKQYQIEPEVSEEFRKIGEEVRSKGRFWELVLYPDIGKMLCYRTNLINGKIDERQTILLKEQIITKATNEQG